MRYALGCLPDKPDTRDFMFSVPLPITLPPSVDLRSRCLPIRDQKSLGACTGFAATALRELMGNATDYLSPLFIYYEERKLEGTIRQDAGAMPRDAFRVMLHLGAAHEVDDPYNITKFAKAPSKKALAGARGHKILTYQRLTSLLALKTALASGQPVLIGMLVYPQIEDAPGGVLVVPGPNEHSLGGHAVTAVGYNNAMQFVTFKNSWGDAWGDGGYGYLPFDYFTPDLVSDMWTANA